MHMKNLWWKKNNDSDKTRYSDSSSEVNNIVERAIKQERLYLLKKIAQDRQSRVRQVEMEVNGLLNGIKIRENLRNKLVKERLMRLQNVQRAYMMIQKDIENLENYLNE
jgi:hypothetical protein